MSENEPRSVGPYKGNFLQELLARVKLILRLMGDNRVSPLLKLIPIGTLVYLFLPLDLPGPVDDAAVIWMGSYLFVEMCPPDVVEEHRRALGQGSSLANDMPVNKKEEDIVDGVFRDED
jgi:hypothetical protein